MPFPVFAKKEEIPAGFESDYEEKDGKFVAKVPDVSTLEGTLATVRKEKKDAEKALKEANDARSDLQRKLDAKEAAVGDTDKKTSDMLAKWEEDKNAAVKVVQDKLDATESRLRTIQVDDRLGELFLASGGRPERKAKAIADVKHQFDLDGDNLVVKDAAGQVTTTKPDEFFKTKYRDEMPEFYTGTKATGGGAGGGLGVGSNVADSKAADRVLLDPEGMLREANAKAAA